MVFQQTTFNFNGLNFSKQANCPLAKSRGFPAPYPSQVARVPGPCQGFGLLSDLARHCAAASRTRQGAWRPSARTGR
ncbi:hypothetical protein FGL97_01315 [Pseudomonas putida]|nr:hypothetical protein [Pseudomonas putida]NVN66883.1 hypothetical protein [Pseudomonas putida]